MLLLSSDLKQHLDEISSNLPKCDLVSSAAVEQLRQLALAESELKNLADLMRSVLVEQGYVQVRSLPENGQKLLFSALASILGDIYIDPSVGDGVIGAHVKPSEMLMGNQLRNLPLHTDYSMQDTPPRLTMSLCIEPDPIPGFGAVQIADVAALCFGVETDLELSRFFDVSIPVASQNAGGQILTLNSPIVTRMPEGRGMLVRYHRTRIRQGFQVTGAIPSQDQSATMLSFERLTAQAVHTLHPEKGDMLVIDNRRTVHARTRCSVRVDADCSTQGRQMRFIFAH